MYNSLLCLLAVLLFGSAAQAADGTSKAAYTVARTVLVNLPTARPDRTYRLIISLPVSFNAEPTRHYPVVFVADGYWYFTAAYAAYGSLSYDKTIPEAIIVGLDYAGENLNYFSMRDDDLLPMAQLPTTGKLASAGADAFLHLIESQAIPLLERDYRADPHYRVLMGVSDGRAFALYTLFNDSDLFQAYVAASPSTLNVWPYEAMFAQPARHSNSRLFMSVDGD